MKSLKVLEEIHSDSGDEDFGGQNKSDSDEEESDTNQHHPLWFYMLLCVFAHATNLFFS